MTPNDILRSIRYTFDLSDSDMMELSSTPAKTVSRETISQWLKRDEDPDFKPITDLELANFLNAFIVKKRGPKDGPAPVPERRITNNIVLKKLKIALNMQSEDIQDILYVAGLEVSDHELSALFRKPDHKNYRDCQDQFLRTFLKGLQLKYRPSATGEK